MTLKVLMVIPKMEIMDFVIDILEQSNESDETILQIDKEYNLQDALDRCRRETEYNLVISYLHIFKQRGTILNESQKLGLILLKNLAEEGCRFTGILLTPEIDEEQEALHFSYPNIFLVPVGENWQKYIEVVARRAFQDASGDVVRSAADISVHVPQKKVQIDFFITSASDSWMVVFRGEGGVICDPTPKVLKVSMQELNETHIKDSMVDRFRGYYPDWKVLLKDIGKVLVREILFNNPEVLNYYNKLSGEIGGCENFRLRFVTGEDAYPLNLEAILVPESHRCDDFWMLKAPVCRRLNVSDLQLYPLFEDPVVEKTSEKINCLIIKADVHGLDTKSQRELEQLRNVALESSQLVKRLGPLRDSGIIDKFRLIPEKDTECTKEVVKDVLQDGTEWHLVHYAGHSHYTTDDKGYVYFEKEGRPDGVNIQDFALWLRKARTRLVYLSSCESSKLRFVNELVRKSVPAVIGYRWNIDDDKAAEQADTFYQHLFKEQSLEYAFLKTRQQVSEKCPEHIIWAAPVLVMQALHH